MSHFLQLHLLTSYPPANLNRDDLGRPKTAIMGGATRLRISSQSLKRAWRTSSIFEEALAGHIGTRTKEKGTRIYDTLRESGVGEEMAFESAKDIAGVFAKLKSVKAPTDGGPVRIETEQLAHFSPEEMSDVDGLVETLAKEKRRPTEGELDLLRKDHQAVDIALFGRMMAAKPDYNVEAAAQVAHAISVHKTQVEEDFFSAVDDLNEGAEDLGAAHLGETEFAAGLFYLYLCIDRELLVKNLKGDTELAEKSLRALVESATKVAPTGKQATFASRAYASYLLAELGDQQPRSLAVAFLEPVSGTSQMRDAIGRLEATLGTMDRAYGVTADRRYSVDVGEGKGSVEELLAFIGGSEA